MSEFEVSKEELEELIEAVYERFQYDFRDYSRSSLHRRTEQAMMKFNCRSVEELKRRLIEEKDFFPKLLNYLTVNTTEMFRDPDYFRLLTEKVFPYLKTYPSVKIWVAGCSTGEEVISLAILLREQGLERYLLYATDISPLNLERAKRAIYSTESALKASVAYREAGGKGSLSDYYRSAYDSVQMDPTLLEKVVFADHSLATDSVFSEVHLISCRNVLIYFDRKLQDRVFRLFEDSLVRDGFLGLGSKESILFSSVKDHFKVVDGDLKIYQKASLP